MEEEKSSNITKSSVSHKKDALTFHRITSVGNMSASVCDT